MLFFAMLTAMCCLVWELVLAREHYRTKEENEE